MMSDNSFSYPETTLIDPRDQLLNYTSIYGDTSITWYDIDYYHKIQVNNAIILGVRIGAAGLAILSLFIVSRKKTSPVFILNQACLLLIIIHSALYISYLLGNYGSLSFIFTNFEELITVTNVNISIVTNCFQLLLVTCVEGSLVFQVYTIFKDPNRKNYRNLFTSISILIASSVVILYLYNTIKFGTILQEDRIGSYTSKALNAQPILFASSVNFMSVLLVGKLAFAIRARRYLGLKQFDGFHILLIMTTQSLVIPSIILIVNYAVSSVTMLSLPLIAQLLIVLSLPLSSMWAASVNDSPNPNSSGSSYSSSFKSPTGNGTSFYSNTLKTGDYDYYSKNTADSINTPSTAIEDEIKRYNWMSNREGNYDLEDECVIHKTVHEISSDISY